MSAPFTPTLPGVIDSTMLVAWRSCPRKFFYEFCYNLAPTGQSVDLHFGGAVARGMEVARKSFYVNGAPARQAEHKGVLAALAYYGDYSPPHSSAKTWENLGAAMQGYFKRWPLDADPCQPHQNIIEFTFAVPIPGTRHPVTGDPFLYGGRYDMLAEVKELGNILAIVDEKTQGKGFDEKWNDKWALRNQFMGYWYASHQLGFNVQRVIIRGISVLKTKIDYLPGFAQYSQNLLDRWLYQTQTDLNKIAAMWENQYFDFNFGDTCTAYGVCPYMICCEATDPTAWFSNYKERNWDPLRQNPNEPRKEELVI